MKRLLCFLSFLTLFCCFAFIAKPAAAAEEILRFHSDLRIQKDSTLLVTERITVRAEGKKIKRGIYRDFPIRYENPDGSFFRIGFKILSVTRDGVAEPYHVRSTKNGRRIYIGDKDVAIAHGIHRYEISYLTLGVVRFYDDFDELYWNVTGNDWDFPISDASAALYLPDGTKISRYHVYTGRSGSRGRDYSAYLDPVTTALSVQSARPLDVREGLTLAAGWPKGIVTPPTGWQRLKWRMAENRTFTAAVLYVPLLFCYLFGIWLLVGRDPDKGTIIPEFTPPDDLSPAVISYIRNMGLGHSDRREAFSAALINLAVKGRIKIHRRAKHTYDLTRLKTADTARLPPGEAYLLYSMFHKRERFTIERAYDPEFVRIMEGFVLAVEGEYSHHYFLSNSKYVTATWWISAPMIFVMMFCTLSGPEYVGPSFALIGATLFLHMAFYALMKAPTMLGREKMDRIEGFRLYLKTAEKSRLDFLHPPEMTPGLFEKYLPYAVVLGVENQWVNYFKKALPVEAQQNYRPHWYHGYGKGGFKISEIGKSFSSNLSATMSRAATAPSSSGGGGFSGGGGSSGGGFGGGGGGGW